MSQFGVFLLYENHVKNNENRKINISKLIFTINILLIEFHQMVLIINYSIDQYNLKRDC
jgi:heme/copper-type cytochrome/quinol oxidase subunit 4